jgi:hypothetical protein
LSRWRCASTPCTSAANGSATPHTAPTRSAEPTEGRWQRGDVVRGLYLAELADLRSVRRLAALGLDLPAPGRGTWPWYQDVGETLSREGWAGLITRSAARAEAFVVCVFPDNWPPHGCVASRAIEIADVPIPPTGMKT